MKDTLTTEGNKDRPQTQTGGKRDEATSDRVAEAGSLDQAGEGISRNVADVSDSFSSTEASIEAFSKGEGDALDVAMNVKGAVDKLRGLSGRISESLMLPIMTKLSAIKGQAILPAAKQMDPVMGVDVHVVTIPPAVPTPLPHPYIGILFRAKDWVSCLVNTYKPLIKETTVNLVGTSFGEGAAASVSKHSEALMGMAMGFANLIASVKFGGFVPRAITGTSTKNFPHIPFGAGWHPSFAVPVKKNHGKVFLGSLFVAADGDPMAGFGHLHYDCWDMGVPDLLKGQRNAVKKSPDPSGPQAELYVPSGMLLPIPWGRPVLVNSIPTPINPLSLGDRLFKAGLSKLRRSRAVCNANEKIISRLPLPCSTKTKLSRKHGTGQSHPVEVAEGYFYTDNEDFRLSGILPLVWERTWYSYSDYKGPLGYGWHHSYDMALGLDLEAGVATFRMKDGRGVDMYLPKSVEKPTFNRLEKLYLCLDTEGNYYVKETSGLEYRFTRKGYAVKGTDTEQYLLENISDENGHCISFAYKPDGAIRQITDSAGRVLGFETDKVGRITAIYAPHPEKENDTFAIARYEYNDEGDMTHHIDALGQKMSFEYSDHLMVREEWRNGTVWEFTYNSTDSRAKCTEVRGSGDLLHYKFNYDDPECTVVTDSLGYRKEFRHFRGRVVKEVDAENKEWRYQYNLYSELQSVVDPLGNATAYMYDDWGNVTSIIEPDGSFTQMGYYHPTNRHLITEATDAHGGKWQWQYDKKGNLVERKNPLGAETQFKYENGLLYNITDALGSQTQIDYDESKNIIHIQSPNNAVTKYGYDRLGQCVQVTNPNGIHQNRQLDLLGRVTTVYDFDNNTIDLEYDAMDNIIRYKDCNKEVHYTYKGLNKLMSRRDSAGTVRYHYDTEGQLRRITNQAGERYSFELDGRGNVVKEKGFDGLTRSYERNDAGWVTKIQRPGKRYTQYKYDPNGRITQVDYHDGTQESFMYEKGLLRGARNDDSIVLFERDAMGNITQEICNGYKIESQYDILGRRTHIGSNLGADIAMELDSLSNITGIEAQGWQAKIDYDKQGLEIQRTLSGGVTSRTQRDKLGRVRYQNTETDGTTYLFREYQWGIDDRLAKIIDHQHNETTAFEYNDRSFLTRAVYNGKEEVWRAADKLGNLYEDPDCTDRMYNSSRLEYDGKRHFYYYYDCEGNLILKSPSHRHGKKPDTSWGMCSYSYEWSANGSLKNVTTPTGKKIEFKYDAFGRRICKSYGSREFLYIWDKNVPLHEIKREGKRGDEITTWIFEGFTPTAKLANGKSYSIITDHIGRPIRSIDDNGELVWSADYDIYGRLKNLKGERTFIPFRQVGQIEDSELEGLYYNRYRWYNSETGCYISQDPISIAGGLNLYSYVFDVNGWVDIFGLDGSPTLPSTEIVNENGIIIEHYYPNDHTPPHVHVYEQGKKNRATKIGENGKPLKNERNLTAKEAKVVSNNKSKIRKSIRKIRKWLGVQIHGSAYTQNKLRRTSCKS